jgi:1-acyl-sn-glycerol-3-phosphate acyltransferase
MLRRLIGSAYLRAIGWTIHGTAPDREHIGVMLAAPHTANQDFLLMLSTAWASELRPKYLIKKEFVQGPLKPFFTLTGAIATDRKNPGTLVEDLTERAKAGESFILVIAPEGTRALTKGWKSGFYRIALDAGIPVTPCSVDSATKQIWFGPSMQLTGDMGADMDRLRAFYADKGGVDPSKKSPVRLPGEDDQPTR